MSAIQSIDGEAFLKAIRPALETGDCAALAKMVTGRWRVIELCQLLQNTDPDVRRVAAVTLGYVGDHTVVCSLARALHDPDEQVNQLAEHSLWTLWFRGGSCKAGKPFREGLALLNIDCYDRAVEKFSEAARIDPTFSEAHNQCAIAHFFMSEWDQSIQRCEQTLKLVPQHFGAMSGLGHCRTQKDQLALAADAYRKALAINPRMPAIAQAVKRIDCKLKGLNDSSGTFESMGHG